MPDAMSQSAEPSSRFSGWEEYPYQRFDPPYSWSLNVCPGQARHFVDHRSEYSHEEFCVDVVTLDHHCANPTEIKALSDLPQIKTFTSEAAFLGHIQTINRDLQCTLIFVRSDLPVSPWDVVDMDGVPVENHESEEASGTATDNIKGKARITASAIFKICTMFEIQQSFLVSLRGDPHFSSHRVRSIHNPDKFMTDISYHIPMPWVHRSREEIAVSPIRQYSISVYSRYREDGRPMFSVFFNVKRSMIKDIKNAWKHCVLDVSTSSPLRLLDHWALQSASLARLQEECRFQEALYEVIFTNSIANHLRGSATEFWGTLALTFSKCSKALAHFESLILPLKTTEEVMQGLLKIQNEAFVGQHFEDGSQDLHLQQEECWSASLLASLRFTQTRNRVSFGRAERVMTHIFTIIRLRDSETMSQNTAHMTRLADAQQQSSLEMRQFTWDSRQDARLMKFLAELTMVFLPITAISTTFSMGFFAIDQSSTAIFPFSSLRHIWVFVLTGSLVSLATWTIWWQRWKKLQLDDRKFREELDDERRAKTTQRS